jgi:DNA topoisomerase-3
VAGRQFEPAEIETLLTRKALEPVTGFRNKMGRPFSAGIRLNGKFEMEFDFEQNRDTADANTTPPDFSAQTPLGKCPKCGAPVFEHGNAYLCEKSMTDPKNCDFRTGKIILQQPVSHEQAEKLLATGRTDLLKDFVSARTRRKFSAFLVIGKDGKVGFEFEKRATQRVVKPQTQATTQAAGGDTAPSTTANTRNSSAKTSTRKRASTRKNA